MIYKGYTIDTDGNGYRASKKLKIFPHFKLYFVKKLCGGVEGSYHIKHSFFTTWDTWMSLQELQTEIDRKLQPKTKNIQRWKEL